MARPLKNYAIYDKNDDLLFVGNRLECAEYLGILPESVCTIIKGTKSGKLNGRKGGARIYVIEDDESCLK